MQQYHSWTKRSTLACLVVTACACGADSPTAPTVPPAPPVVTTVTTTSVSIAGSIDMLRRGETATFAATVVRSDGSAATVTDWSTDAPTVLSIGATGVAVGLSAGEATITARHGGVAATRRLRVVPEYQGTWAGTYRVNTCVDSGDFVRGWCDATLLSILPFSLTLNQTRDSVSGTVAFGAHTGGVSGTIAADGTLTLSGVATLDTFSMSITAWSTNSREPGSMTGSFSQRVSSTDLSGRADHECEVLSAARSSSVLRVASASVALE